MHDMVNLNATQFIYNPTENRFCTLKGHVYAHLAEAPSLTSTIWNREVPYPADERIIEVMERVSLPEINSNNLDNSRDSTVTSNSGNPSAAASEETSTPPPVSAVHRIQPNAAPPMGSVESAARVLTGADTYVNAHSNVLEFAVQRGPSPADSLPDLESISSSSSDFEFSDFEYRIVEPCTTCGGPQHRRIDDCPNWTLPSSSTKEHDLRNEDEVKTARKSIESTPKAPSLTLGFTPIMDNPLHREPPRPDTPDPFARSQDTNTILESMRGMLGLHNPTPADPEKMMEMARIAAHQAHEAYEFFHQKAEERRQRQVRAEYSTQYVQTSQIVAQMFTTMLQNYRPPFAMGLGMQTAMNDGGRREAGRSTAYIHTDASAQTASWHLDPRRGTRAVPPILDSSEDQPTPTLSEVDVRLEAIRAARPTNEISETSTLASPYTDRSVESDEEFFDPRAIIDAAVRRVITEDSRQSLSTSTFTSEGEEVPFPGTSVSPSETPSEAGSFDGDDAEIDGLTPAEFLQTVVETTGIQPQYDRYPEGNDSQLCSHLEAWSEAQMTRELHLSRWDAAHVHSDWDRAQVIIQQTFGPLLKTSDTDLRLLRQNVRPRYGQVPETPGSYIRSHTIPAGSLLFAENYSTAKDDPTLVSDTEPDPTQSPTSLDFSLNTPALPVPCSVTSFSSSVDSGPSDRENRDKRKTSGSGTSTVERPRKRYRKFDGESLRQTVIHSEAIKATHLVDPDVLADLADFRYFVLHGVELAQDMLVRQKADVRGATEYFFGEHNWADNVGSSTLQHSTTQRPHHSLFHDIETAKISIIQSLLRAYNYADLAHRLGHFLSLQFRDTYVLGIILDAGILDRYSPRSSPALWDSDMPDSSDEDMEGLTLGYPTEPRPDPVHVHPEPPERRALAAEVRKQEAGNNATHKRKENTMEVIPTASLAPTRVEEAATCAAARELVTYMPIGAFDSNEDADAEGEMCYRRIGESSAH
ncbi:hypothetical protein DFH07DRAFT_968025 [Mycena maculata]|uniref:Uncharacterized protein n=1 Tax=Mycena maculata TaxID=230809 RepID=A0AAD7MWA2_9AGAR|nr:hypothetical protein DFH07DRAFT_968025 [Mycena maculata]